MADGQGIQCPLVEVDELPQHADLAIECAPAAIIERICRPMLEAGKAVMVLSCGALLDRPALVDLAKERGGQIIVPTGALLGLDAVTAAAEGQITAVRMMTRKPPRGLAGRPTWKRMGFRLMASMRPSRCSRHSPGGGGRIPANVNVAAALALAGIGPERTTIEIWADPSVERNCHRSWWTCGFSPFYLGDREYSLREPQDGRITALSVLAALRKLHAPLRVGT